MTLIRKRLLIVCLVSSLFASANTAYALAFEPTESEWLAWPDYCRARYVVSGAGRTSMYANRVSPEEVTRQQANLGDGWHWLHHYCAALAYLERANTEREERWVAHWLEEAELNLMGYYERIDREHPMFIQVITHIAQLYRKRGDSSTALRFLREGMKLQPQAASPYELASLIYEDDGDVQSALAVLLEGNQATSGNSAEIHYFLGHLYIDINDFGSAVKHAKRAYELGYPLPGLATKLRRLGHPLGENSDS